jgi:hypothetical protein
MRSKLTLLATAAVLAFGLSATAALAEDAPGAKGDAPGAKSDITIVKDSTSTAPGGSAVEQDNQGAADEGGAAAQDPADEGDAVQAMPPASDDGGVGAQGGAEDQGATGKSTEDLGAPAAKPPVQEGKLPSPSSSY